MRHTLALILVAAALSGCAAMKPPQPGWSEQQTLAHWGAPTSRYAMPDGVTRLEYATGPFGQSTWMIDVDAAGRVIAAQQVLTEDKLRAVQGRLPGMSRDELLRTLGRPGERRGGGWQGGEVWSWRYQTHECW
ncbi:hypothetical protein CLD22_25990, partial [Rubrivivax gelatinosus]|nr:hypothetical protein [Rubrivivax gelatinosus]